MKEFNLKEGIHIKQKREFKIGDTVTSAKDYKWLKHYYAKIIRIIGDEYFLEKVKDLGTDENNQWRDYAVWKADDLKIVKNYNNNK